MKLTLKFSKTNNKEIKACEKEYAWFSELSKKGKRRAAFEIKKFKELGVAVPVGLIYKECKLL